MGCSHEYTSLVLVYPQDPNHNLHFSSYNRTSLALIWITTRPLPHCLRDSNLPIYFTTGPPTYNHNALNILSTYVLPQGQPRGVAVWPKDPQQRSNFTLWTPRSWFCWKLFCWQLIYWQLWCWKLFYWQLFCIVYKSSRLHWLNDGLCPTW